jgi:hypothetical protein
LGQPVQENLYRAFLPWTVRRTKIKSDFQLRFNSLTAPKFHSLIDGVIAFGIAQQKQHTIPTFSVAHRKKSGMTVICGNDGGQLPVTDTLASVGLQAALFQQPDSGKVAVVPALRHPLWRSVTEAARSMSPRAQPSVYDSVTYAHLPVVWVVQPDTA